MATAKLEELTLEQQISQLEAEICSRNADIRNLAEALSTLEAGKPRPQNPSADAAFELLRELVGNAPQQLERQQNYDEKVRAARTSLRLATEICGQKTTELRTLQQQMRSQQADLLVRELLEKASQFNLGIDMILDLYAEMQSLNAQIHQLRGGKAPRLLTVYAEMIEMPFCRIDGEAVSILRRFDVKLTGED